MQQLIIYKTAEASPPQAIIENRLARMKKDNASVQLIEMLVWITATVQIVTTTGRNFMNRSET